MKKFVVLTALSLLLVTTVASAQVGTSATKADNPDKYIEMFRSDLAVERVNIITEVMDFTTEEGEVFWPLYREYDLAKSKIGDQSIALIKTFADNFGAMTDDMAKDIVHGSAKIQQERIKLRKQYFDKVAKIIPSHKAARFYQIDSVIDQLVNLQVAGSLPLFE